MKKSLLALICLLFLAMGAKSQTSSSPNQGLLITSTTSGAFTLSWWGNSGCNYFIQQSNDLISGWVYLTSTVSGSSVPIMETGSNAVIQWGFSDSATKGFFRLQLDTDQNGLPDSWEISYTGTTGNNPSTLSSAGDGYTLLQEFQLGRNPNDYYQGVAPTLEIIQGNNQTCASGTYLPLPLIIKVENGSGIAFVNAPVTFNVISGGGAISLLSSGSTQSSLSLRTDSAGEAQVYFKLPATVSGSDQITLSAGIATPAVFNEAATPSNAPQVTLLTSGSALAPSTVSLTATITSSVTKVDFYEGQQYLGTDTSSPYTLTVPNVGAGVHTYTAVATNSSGITGQATANFTATVAETPFTQYRYTRGTGTDPSYQTFVIALNQTAGILLDATGNNAENFPSGVPWFTKVANSTAYHVSVTGTTFSGFQGGLATYPASQAFQNPVVAFGAVGGGTPLYTNQSYSFGFGSGGQDASMTTLPDIRIRVYAKSAFVSGTTGVLPVATGTFTLPRQGTADWTIFAQNGFRRTYTVTSGSTTYPLVTTFQYEAALQENAQFGSNSASPFILTHTASSSDYYYEIDYQGVANESTITVTGSNNITIGSQEFWMAMSGSSSTPNAYSVSNSSGVYSLGYTLDFTTPSPQVSTYISQPQFQGQPLPSPYEGLSVAELLNLTVPVTYQFVTISPTSSTLLALDGTSSTPELRSHPILDKFVSDSGSNAMVLANYVLNNIQLADPLSYDRNGDYTTASINCGGVDRGALATFMEKQGNPIEQCALLVYFLRKCNVPCGYVFPTNNSLQMLDERMSYILRMQLHNAVDLYGNPIMPQIIPVNYPWVAAYVSGKWIHIFPWLKDTAISQGYNLNTQMPTGYQSGLQWMQKYIGRDSNILSLSTVWDDPNHLFVPFVQKELALNNNGVGLSNVGIVAYDRQNFYSSWSQFPQPWGLSGTLADSNFQASLGLTPNVFNTVEVTVHTYGNGGSGPTTIFDTGPLRAMDLHNRRLMVQEVKNASGGNYTMTLSLAPFRPGTSGTSNFSSGDIVNKQVLSGTAIPLSDVVFDIDTAHVRNINLPSGSPPSQYQWNSYLGVLDTQSFNTQNIFFSGDLVTLCIDFGRVTQQMLDVHAQTYWLDQQAVAANPSANIDPDDLIGEPLYLMGMSFYNQCDNFQVQAQSLYQEVNLSNIHYGTAKMNAQRNADGSLPSGNINPKYPCFDVTGRLLVQAAYNSDHADTSMPYTQDSLYVRLASESAAEHTVINTFFNLTDSASTVHLLDVAELAGHTPPFLTSQNYATSGTVNYTVSISGTNTTKTLSAWSGSEWSTIQSYFTNNPYAFAYITPGPVTCANGSYTGMGYLIADGFGNTASLLAFNQQQIPINGGNGDALPSTYAISATTANNWEMTYNGGSYNISYTPVTTSSPYFITGAVAPNNYSTVYSDISAGTYIEANWDVAEIHNANIALGYKAPGSALPTTGTAIAAENKQAANSGWLGAVKYWGSVAYKTVLDPVDVVDGAFHIDDLDLSVPGPFPIQLRRNYDSLNQSNNEFGFGWKSNFSPYLAVSNSSSVIYAAEMDGSVVAYTGTGTTPYAHWVPQASTNPSLVNQHGSLSGGLTNLFNNRLDLSGSTYTLTGADGSVRTYVTASYTTGTSGLTRARPYLTKWQDPQGNYLSFSFGNTTGQNDYGFLNRITSSNGNYIQLDYDVYGHIISANSGDGRQTLYGYDVYGDLTGVTRVDSSQVIYTYEHQTQSVSGTAQTYSDHLLLQETKPSGRLLVNSYDTSRRVTQQKATVGPNDSLVTNGTFVYSGTTNSDGTITGTTSVSDAYSRTTLYSCSNSLITQVADPSPLTTKVQQSWYTTTNGSGAYQRSLQQRVDKRGLTQTFKYDGSGNLVETDTMGDLTGSGTQITAITTGSYNSRNLPTSIVDQSTGNTRTFSYGNSSFPYLVTQIQFSTPSGVVSQTVNTYQNLTSGTGYGMLMETTQAQGTSDAATTDYTYTFQGYIATETHKTNTSDPAVSYSYGYNAAGELVQVTDAAGRLTQLAYDALGHVISKEVYDQSGNLLSFNYNFYNQNGELEWTEGPRFNPDDYTYRKYDGAGRLSQFLQYRSQAKPDGSGVQQAGIATTSNQYDLFGNLTLTMDPNGNTVQTGSSGYDAIGRLLTRKFYDSSNNLLATESFTYDANNSGDKIATYTDALGAVTQYSYTQTGQLSQQINPDLSTYQWRYQPDGRLSEEDYPNNTKRTISYDDFNRTITRTLKDSSNNPLSTEKRTLDRRGNVVATTDVSGFTTSTTFDGFGRVKTFTGPPAGNGSAQQQITHAYDSAGILDIATNAVGESTITTFDGLHRPIQIQFNSPSGQTVRRRAFNYSPDHHSVTTIDDTTTNVTTTFTDVQGNPVLVKKADGGFVLSQFDSNENLIGTTDEQGRSTSYSYDGLNRPTQQQLSDGAQINFTYDLANKKLTRSMPGNLIWTETFDTSNRETSESLAQGSNTTRSYSYTYYTSGTNIGRLNTVTDPNGIVSTYSYDSFRRLQSVAAVDPSSAQLGVTQIFNYDLRGLLTELDQTYQSSSVGPTTSVVRNYDGYGAISNEQVYINGTPGSGTLKDTWQETHDGAGRRSSLTELNNPSLSFAYAYRADDALTETDFNGSAYTYRYGNDGLLIQRNTPFNVQTIVSRDAVGRITEQTQTVNGSQILDETNIAWRNDSTQSSYTANRTGSGVWNETRSYSYDDTSAPNHGRGRLLSEGYAPSSSGTATLAWTFDNNTSGGPGLLTGVTLSGALTGSNTATYGNFVRLNTLTSTGSLTGPLGTPVSNTFDAVGQTATSAMSSGSDTMTWDAFGRLAGITRRDSSNNGFNWNAVYDGFGRRLQTIQQAVIAGGTTGTPLVVQSSFDPDVQFMEVAVTVNGQRDWLVHGPDLNGQYGKLEGTGGIEAIFNSGSATTTGIVSNVYGHTEAIITAGSVVNWNPVHSDGYGPLPGSTAQAVDATHDVSVALAWRGHYVDGTGYYYFGSRYYAPDSATWLSPDPLGHSASLSLYDYCAGDGINRVDPDGRIGKGAQSGYSGTVSSDSPNSAAFRTSMLISSAYFGAWSGEWQGVQNVTGYTTFQNNQTYYRGNIGQSLNATYNPILIGSTKYAEAFGGTGYSYNNSGSSLNLSDKLWSFGEGTLAWTSVVAPLETGFKGAFTINAAETTTPTVDRIRQVAQQGFDYAVNNPRVAGLNRMQLGKDAEVQATRWLRRWAESNDVDLGSGGLQFQVRGASSVPDVVYDPASQIFDFKLTPKAVRPAQTLNFQNDFPGYNIEYIYGHEH